MNQEKWPSTSPHYDLLIKEAVEKPPPPLTHDTAVEPLLRTSPRRQGRPRGINSNSQLPAVASSHLASFASQTAATTSLPLTNDNED